MERLEIIETLKHFPNRLEAALDAVPEAALSLKPGEDEWSIKEVVGHLAYAEEIWYRRLYQVWSLHDPVLMAFDPALEEASINRAAASSDLAPFLAEIRAKRPRIVDLLSTAVDWTRTGQWRGTGRRSLKQLALALLDHDEDHLRQIAALKAAAGAPAPH